MTQKQLPTNQSRSAGSARRKLRASGPGGQPKQKATKPSARVVPSLSKCAMDYARCLVNPFTGPLACIPSYPALMSRKVRVWSKGVMETGSSGMGFVCADPLRGAVSDVSCVNFTDNSFAGSSILTPATAGVVNGYSNADYVNSQVATNGITFRVVASGIRVRYVGTELDRGGYAVALSDTNHNSLYNRNISQLDAEINSKRFPINREWITVVYRPVRDEDDDFGGISTQTPAATDLSFYQGIAVNAPASNSITFEWEYYSIYEYQGATARGQTPSHVDTVGYGAVSATTTFSQHLMPYSGQSHTKEKPLLKDVVGTLANSSSGWMPVLKGVSELFEENFLQGGIDIATGVANLLFD